MAKWETKHQIKVLDIDISINVNNVRTVLVFLAAVAPSWLATLPENVEAPKGDYVWFSKRIVDWIHGPMPGNL